MIQTADLRTGGCRDYHAPTAKRVINALQVCKVVTKLLDQSHLFAEGNRNFLYSPDIWAQVNDKLATALAACAATAEKDFKARTKKYLRKCIAINQFVTQLRSSEIC